MTENELSKIVFNGVRVKKQKPLPLISGEIKLDAGYRVDFLKAN
jgi:hypothetical protein